MISPLRQAISTIATIAMASCVSTAHELHESLDMPETWNQLLPIEASTSCLPINTKFKNVGISTNGHDDGLKKARLDSAIGRVLGEFEKPNQIAISSNAESNNLHITYIGAEHSLSFPISSICENGWFTWSDVSKDQNLADGITLISSNIKYRIRQGEDFSIIVHAKGELEYSSSMIFQDQEFIERWSKFSPAEF